MSTVDFCKEDDFVLKNYIVVFYNRFANETQTYEVMAINEFRAGRAFYRKYNRKAYHDCIELIKEVKVENMIYLIEKHDFDTWENTSSNARYKTLVGYANSEEEAIAYIDKYPIHTYEGWDGQRYPYFTATPVEKVK